MDMSDIFEDIPTQKDKSSKNVGVAMLMRFLANMLDEAEEQVDSASMPMGDAEIRTRPHVTASNG